MGIPSLNLLVQLIFLNFFRVERISHCNCERDLGKCLVAGLTKMPDQSLLQRFLDNWNRKIIDSLLTAVSKQAHILGHIIGRILNIDTHTKPFEKNLFAIFNLSGLPISICRPLSSL